VKQVKVLEHHAEMIRDDVWRLFGSLCPSDDQIAKYVQCKLRFLATVVEPNGVPGYPNLNERAFARIFSLQVLGVLGLGGWRAEVVPDWNLLGRRNFDGLCQTCGELYEEGGVWKCRRECFW